jgi:hypothetical protein
LFWSLLAFFFPKLPQHISKRSVRSGQQAQFLVSHMEARFRFSLKFASSGLVCVSLS